MSTASRQSSSEANQDTRTAAWVDEKSSPPSQQSQIFEVEGDEVPPHMMLHGMPHDQFVPELYESSEPLSELPTSVPCQRQASPELLYPVNNKTDRDSLWQRRHGRSATHRRSSVGPGDWSVAGDTANSILSLSSRPSKLNRSLQVQPNNEELLASDTSNRPWMANDSAPRGIPPTTSAPAIVSPYTPSSELAALSPNIVSPMTLGICSPSNSISPATMVCHDAGFRPGERHEDVTSFRNTHGQSSPDFTRKDPNDTCSALNVLESKYSSQQPGIHSKGILTCEAQQANDITPQCSPNFVHGQDQIERLNAPSTPLQPKPPKMYESRSENPAPSNNIDTMSNSDVSWSTQIDTLLAESSSFLPSNFPFEAPPQTPCAERSSQSTFDNLPPTSPDRPIPTFNASTPLLLLSPPLKIVPGSMGQNRGISHSAMEWTPPDTSSGFGLARGKRRRTDFSDNCEIKGPAGKDKKFRATTPKQAGETYQSKRLGTEQFLSCSELPLGSPLDRPIATFASESYALDQKRCLEHSLQQQSATEDNTCGFAALSAMLQPHCFDCNSLRVGSSEPQLTQVTELRKLVLIINNEWMQRMESTHDVISRCHNISKSNLFDRAVRSFKDFVYNPVPRSFEEVFVIMHLAFAAAFCLHWSHDYFSWDALCCDALQWQHAISTDEDKILFLNAIGYWWSPDLKTIPLSLWDCHGSFISIKLQEPFQPHGQERLWDVLGKSEICKSCMGILDGKLL